jgi:MOSC domain-containing protein YiiM
MQFERDSISERGRVASVNVGVPRTVEWLGRPVTSGIWKQPVDGPIAVRGVNLSGDDQADHSAHGGPDKAVYAYALEDYNFWQDAAGFALEPGLFGENLTLAGVDASGARIGERWQIGTVLLEVSGPRIPCYKLGMRVGDHAFPPRFAAAGRPGAYLRIVREGVLAAGDEVSVVYRPDHDVTPRFVSRAYYEDRSLLPRLLEIPELSASWRDWAARVLDVRPSVGARGARS